MDDVISILLIVFEVLAIIALLLIIKVKIQQINSPYRATTGITRNPIEYGLHDMRN
jgi:hypothetical protein